MIALLSLLALAPQISSKSAKVPPDAPPPAVVPSQSQDPGVASPPKGNVAQYFGYDQYPPDALRANEQGRVVARLAVNVDGAVTECEVTISSGFASLDAATCRIAMERIRLSPARDAAGKPVASHYVLPVNWMMPDTEPYFLSVAVKIDAAGTVLSCKMTGALAMPVTPHPCERFPVGARSGFTLRHGSRRVGGIVTMTNTQTVQPDR